MDLVVGVGWSYSYGVAPVWVTTPLTELKLFRRVLCMALGWASCLLSVVWVCSGCGAGSWSVLGVGGGTGDGFAGSGWCG